MDNITLRVMLSDKFNYTSINQFFSTTQTKAI